MGFLDVALAAAILGASLWVLYRRAFRSGGRCGGCSAGCGVRTAGGCAPARRPGAPGDGLTRL